MGYRSKGAIWLSKEAMDKLPAGLAKDLAENWDKPHRDVYSFDGWKWYEANEQIQAWGAFMESLTDDEYDFISIGEDAEGDIDIATGTVFYAEINWKMHW
jgi:hypothetical protein